MTHVCQRVPQVISGNDGRNFGILLIDIEINLWQYPRLVSIQYDPIDKIEALVHPPRLGILRCTEVMNASSPSAILDLIFWNIHVDEISILSKQRRPGAIINNHLFLLIGCFLCQGTRIEKVCQRSSKAFPKDRVVPSEEGLDQSLDLLRRTKRLLYGNPPCLHATIV